MLFRYNILLFKENILQCFQIPKRNPMLVFIFMLKQDVDGNIFFSVTSSASMYAIFCLERLDTSLDIV